MNVWNEIDYMPLRKRYCDENNLELYVVDNMSDDGTWEYLQDNNISCHRIDTNGTFHLSMLQQEVARTVHDQELTTDDWVIYSGCDQFACIDRNIHDWLHSLSSRNINTISSKLMSMFNTGELHEKFDPVNTFHHGNIMKQTREFIHKYTAHFKYIADGLHMNSKKRLDFPGITINYGQTKPAEEREATFARRRKAWTQGLPKAWGSHYKSGQSRKWKWDEQQLIDIRESQYDKHVDRLRKLSHTNANSENSTPNLD